MGADGRSDDVHLELYSEKGGRLERSARRLIPERENPKKKVCDDISITHEMTSALHNIYVMP